MTQYIMKKKWEAQKLAMFIQLLIMPFAGLAIVVKRNWNNLAASSVCNVSLDLVGMTILLLLFMSAVKDREDNTLRTGTFAYLIHLTNWALMSDLLCWTLNGVKEMRILHVIASSAFYIFGVAVMVMFWHYLVAVIDSEDPRLKRMTNILNIGGAVTFLAILGNIPGEYYFCIDENGNYHRDTYYLGSQLFLVLLFVLVIILITKMEISKEKKRALSSFISLPIIASVYQAFFFGISVTYFAVVLALIVIYGNVFTEQNRENLEQKKAIAERNHELTLHKLSLLSKEKEILLEREKHQRLETELNLASDIQTHVIPMVFPAFPQYREFALYASMSPAKEVGGDFYDFFLLDEDHLVLVIADVSGKGIPAALYMMIAKTMVSNAAAQGLSPKQIMGFVNQQLCNNAGDVEMFVTVWLGIVEIHTGKVIAANAGHEYPALRRSEGGFELLRDAHGLVLGGLPGMKYKEYEFTIEPGGALFVYTDGVTEAVNKKMELFGLDNMLRSLNKDPFAAPEVLLNTVRQDIDAFAGEEDQFDDITMLAFVRKDLSKEKKSE